VSRTVLAIGANGGFGSALTRKMLARGYSVAATVSRPEKLGVFLREFPECSQVVALDLADGDRIAGVLGDVLTQIPQLDAVVVCGAVAPLAPAEMTPLNMFRETMEVNCLSNLAIYQTTMQALRRNRGRLILTSSYSGRVATPMMAAYVASKFALEGLTDVIRQEARQWGVEVVLLQPGMIDTPMIRRTQSTLATTIAALPEQQRILYGTLYRQMKYRADSALEAGGITSPDVAADAAIRAIEADVPQSRYPIGADAEFMVAASKTKSDREIDDLVLDIYRSAPVA
jgi:NAD(P)-dependent dehydrogenase (short-subunit alcohol dehydrogenase family)